MSVAVERRFTLMVWGLVGLFSAVAVAFALRRWRGLSAHEAEWIAQALVAGHGYSFDGFHRWLFPPGRADQYFTTAWMDPLFPFLYAGLIWVFDEWSRLVTVLLLIACSAAAAAVTAFSARRLAGPWAGIAALVCLLLSVRGAVVTLNASHLAALFVALVLFLLLVLIERKTAGAAAALGLVLGLAILTWSMTMVFLPVVAVLIVWFTRARGQAVRLSSIVVVIPVLMVAPWTVRNYIAFGEFVPVRVGVGQLAYTGTVGLGSTFAADGSAAPLDPPWRSDGPFDAVAATKDREQRRAIERWQLQVMASELGPELTRMDEVARDKWLFSQARAFVVDQPLLTIELGLAKMAQFLRLGRLPAITVMAVLGALVLAGLAVRNRALAIPLALAASYVAPFVIIVPYYFRYRIPIEPVLAVIAGVAMVELARIVMRRARPRLGVYADRSSGP